MSLVEAVISCFLLLMCFLVVINLFNSGLNYGARTESQQLAAMLAERQLEQMRIWAGTINGNVYNFDNLAAIYDGTTVALSDFSGIKMATNVTNTTLYSPCSQVELGVGVTLPYVQPRQMDSCAKRVQVTASWGQGAQGVTLASLFSKPALFFQTVSAINISIQSGGSTTLSNATSASFKAVGYDSNGSPITNLFFVWDVSPINASATLVQARDGSLATLTNQIYVPPYLASQSPPFLGTPTYSVGQLYVRATAVYHGITMGANSTMMTLTP